jgi:stalled ribosome rescue protein Dom34
MKTEMGLWIDRRTAVIVTISDAEDEVRRIDSEVEERQQRANESPQEGSPGSRRAPADDIQQRIQTERLNTYYDTVIEAVSGAESILVMGPGEAKGELKARLDRKKPDERVVGVVTAGKLTDRQIAAKVREHFAK